MYSRCDVLCNGLVHHGDLKVCNDVLYLTGVFKDGVNSVAKDPFYDLEVSEIEQLTDGMFSVFVLGKVVAFTSAFWASQVERNFEYIYLFEGGKEIKEYTCDSCGGAFRYGELNSETYDGIRKEVCDECFTREELNH